MTLEDLRSRILAYPGAEPRDGLHGSVMYKVMGKMFAITWPKAGGGVILKCDPHLAETLRAQYRGVGHRSHLDPRFWIAVELSADVPDAEIERLVAHSYEQVRAGLTRAQRSALEAAGPR